MNATVRTRENPASSSYPLITKERTQKLELLNHLTANLANTIVVCGPEGIGKTKLLKIFQQNSAQSCMICWLQSDNKLSFSEILNAIFATICEYLPDLKSQSLATALDRILSRGAKIILVADDAGQLVPGLIEKIIGYSNAHPALRVVLALTHGELYLKNTTDPALEDCYLVEIPSLSEQQCEDYLEYLSTLPQPRIDFSQINEEKVAQVFRETHGVPGKILTLLPEPVVKKNVDYSKPILLVAVTGLVLLALGVQWWSAHHPIAEATKNQVNQQAASNLANAQSAGSSSVNLAANTPRSDTGELEIAAVNNSANPPNQAAEQATANVNNGELQNNTGVQPQVPTNQQSPAISGSGAQSPNAEVNNNGQPQINQDSAQTNAESGGNVSEGGHWLAAQPSVNYTLQLMAMSNEQVILEVLQRYPELSDELRYIKTKTRRGKDRFILFYGSFSDPQLIKTEKQKLPKELQKIWVRQIADLQKELNTAGQVPVQTD